MGAENIDQAIALVYATVDFVKKERAAGLGYSFAGEAAIIDVVRPAMVENGIVMRVLEVLEFETDTYTTSKGAVMNRTLLKARIRFTHAPSGTHVDCEALGEGADSGDKSANKAMTGAYKYAIRQTFMIETGDDPDRDSSDEQERKQERSTPRQGGSVRSDGKGGSPLPAEPAWHGEFTEKAKETGIGFNEIGAVLGVRVTKTSWRGDIGRWLASDPKHSIDRLVSLAADMKAEVSDAIV